MSGRLAAVASLSNGSWQTTLYSYDTDGRVATRYTYTHGNGGTTVLTALNTTVTYSRDLRDALTQRVTTVGASSFYQWYDYDNRGLLWKASAATTNVKPGTPDVTYTYRPSGQVQNRQFLGGPLVPFTYTIREQLGQLGDPATTTYPFSAKYTYNTNGTVSEAEYYSAGSPATAKRYKYTFGTAGYDALNRLKSADFSSWSGSAWTSTLAHDLTGITYDAAGNLTALQRYRETGTLIDNLTYTIAGSSNRLTSIADAVGVTAETWDAEAGSFTYDVNGNLKTAPAPYTLTAATYNYQNLPVSLTANGATTAYRYDDAGQRITKQVGAGNTEVYLLEGATALGVFTVNAGGTVVSSYFNVLAGDKVVGRQPSVGNRRYYHTDLLGSTRAVVDGTTVLESYDPDPWGLAMPGRSLVGTTKEGFTGKEQDAESGLDYFGARYYLPALGRFGAVDPLGSQFASWSPYGYAFDNPVRIIDPTGMMGEDCCEDWWHFGRGVGRGLWTTGRDAVVGTAKAVAHPLKTARALGNAASHPVQTAAAVGQAITDQAHKFVNGTAGERGEVVGTALATVGLLAAAPEGEVADAAPVAAKLGRAAEAGAQTSEAFHYTFGRNVESIQTNGLRQGTFATPSGALSPLQAQIELALPPNRGLPDAVIRIDVDGLRQAGFDIPSVTRVAGRFGLAGGGYEMKFPYPVPPDFVKVVP